MLIIAYFGEGACCLCKYGHFSEQSPDHVTTSGKVYLLVVMFAGLL